MSHTHSGGGDLRTHIQEGVIYAHLDSLGSCRSQKHFGGWRFEGQRVERCEGQRAERWKDRKVEKLEGLRVERY